MVKFLFLFNIYHPQNDESKIFLHNPKTIIDEPCLQRREYENWVTQRRLAGMKAHSCVGCQQVLEADDSRF